MVGVLVAVAFTAAANATSPPNVSTHQHIIPICKSNAWHRKHHSHCRTHRHAALARAHSPVRVIAVSQAARGAGASNAAVAERLQRILEEPCQNTQLMPSEKNLQAVRKATLCLINQERARNGENPLHVNEQLEGAAQNHSDGMVSEHYFDHLTPTGKTPLQRVQATGYIPNQRVGYIIGENIAWGTFYLASPEAIVQAWIASPEHLENILEAEYRDTAIGVTPAPPTSVVQGEPGATYTEDFGVLRD
jgi:uncharacterized protein YkwD